MVSARDWLSKAKEISAQWKGRFPLEPIVVGGSAALGGFAFALGDGALADGCGHHAGINVEGFFAGMLFMENFYDFRSVLFAEESCGALGDFFFGHRFVFGMADAVDEFVEDGADHDGNIGGDCGRGGIVGMHGEILSVHDGREAELGHATDVRGAGRAIFGDDGGADVDELAIGNCLEIVGLNV
jgi:hypothetical protein